MPPVEITVSQDDFQKRFVRLNTGQSHELSDFPNAPSKIDATDIQVECLPGDVGAKIITRGHHFLEAPLGEIIRSEMLPSGGEVSRFIKERSVLGGIIVYSLVKVDITHKRIDETLNQEIFDPAD